MSNVFRVRNASLLLPNLDVVLPRGKWKRADTKILYCMKELVILCDVVEDENHIILECPLYSDLRNILFQKLVRNVESFDVMPNMKNQGMTLRQQVNFGAGLVEPDPNLPGRWQSK